MIRDWIDEIYVERSRGINRPLYQSQHDAVNSRYPGLTIKHCPICDVEIDDCRTDCGQHEEEENP